MPFKTRGSGKGPFSARYVSRQRKVGEIILPTMTAGPSGLRIPLNLSPQSSTPKLPPKNLRILMLAYSPKFSRFSSPGLLPTAGIVLPAKVFRLPSPSLRLCPSPQHTHTHTHTHTSQASHHTLLHIACSV